MSDYTHSFIILHGFTMTSEDMEYLKNKISNILPKKINVNYILPQAPKRKITIYNEEETAWFDYYTENVYTEEKISIDDLKESRLYIHSLIDEEISKLNDPGKVFLVGYSQGCCQMLDAGLTYPKKLGGLIGFKGHILSYTHKYNIYDQSIWVTHGKKDDAIGYELAKTSYDEYKKVNKDIKFITLENKNHDLNSGINHAMKELSKWLIKKI